jgi:Protein kinase domain
LETERYLLMVMEYVEGRTAAALIDEGRIPLGHALRIATEICEALIYAHDRGFIHCDLKPSNVQVTPDGTAKVLDFGLARAKYDHYEIDPDSPEGGALLIGTPPYMPPERLLKGMLSVSGDIYSLGVTLFEMVTGRLPFQERESATLIGAIIGTAAPAVSSFVDGVPASIDQVVARSLAKDPQERYQTAREFHRDLKDALALLDTGSSGSPIPAANPKQLGPSSRIFFALAATLGAIAALSFIGFVTSTVYGSPLGLTSSFEGESPLWWPVWGVRSLILPVGQIAIAILIFAIVGQVWRTALIVCGPLRHWYERHLARYDRLRIWAKAIPLRTAASALVIAHLLAQGLFYLRFRELIESFSNFLFNSGRIESLSTVNAFDHQLWMRASSLVLLVFGWGWYRLWNMKSRRTEPRSAITFVAGAALMVGTVLQMTCPYRLFFQSKGERVFYESNQCYAIGTRGNDVLIFCPTQDRPWSRLVNRNDPALKPSGTREPIFSAATTNQPKSQKIP